MKGAEFSQIEPVRPEINHGLDVRRLRPQGVETVDYTQADSTRSLWFAEGFTQYYGPLLIHRAGESSLDDYLKTLGGTLNYVVNAPGRAYGSPQEIGRAHV